MSELKAAQFVHLRLHSAYSLLEGAIRLKGLAGLVRKGGMPAVAITDTGNLFGALEASET
ncbi:MAG: PHP domain-containing protein, partial [Rhodobiaceae bacterium]|nr:PHP domain-containing protein [Rhodobiaceae bacterium]